MSVPKKTRPGKSGSSTGTQNNLAEYELSNDQLSFFFLPEISAQKHSHLMDLYDAVPRIHWGRINRQKDAEGNYLPRQILPSLSKEFVHRKRRYTMILLPARILRRDNSNIVVEEWEYYPQVREELVEDALRKMASYGRGAFFRKKGATDFEERTGVVFSIYSLQNELAKYGHNYSYDEIKEALLILRRTTLSIFDEAGKQMLEHNIFTALGLSEKTGRGNAFVIFNPLVTRSIQARTFRQYNYHLTMGLKYALSRWFYKKLCLCYTQASRLYPYTIKISTMIRDSGIKAYSKISNNIREVEKTFQELTEKKVISSFDDERIFDECRRNRIFDVKYTLYPHDDFVREMRRFNEAFNHVQKPAKQHQSGKNVHDLSDL